MSPESQPSDPKPEPDPYDDSLDFDSNCSTPYVSAPSSPGRGVLPFPPSSSGYFFSAPASPMHFFSLSSSSSPSYPSLCHDPCGGGGSNGSFEFEFSSRAGSPGHDASGAMSSADELFLNGQIRPMKLSTHLERPQVLTPLVDLVNEGDEDGEGEGGRRGREFRLKNKSLRRRTRSMSPLRNLPFDWDDEGCAGKAKFGGEKEEGKAGSAEKKGNEEEEEEALSFEAAPSMSASSSRSSSAGRSSKRWVFLKDFLRSKSEGRSNNKFWATISFSPAKEKRPPPNNAGAKDKPSPSGAAEGAPKKAGAGSKGASVNGKKRLPARSAHELHYTANRAQSEELRKRTFLPYREGLFGCLGFSSKGYGTLNGLARALNPVSSR